MKLPTRWSAVFLLWTAMLCSCQTKRPDDLGSGQISVYGEVDKPFTIFLADKMSVSQAIAKAGLMKQGAQSGIAVISRKRTRKGYKRTLQSVRFEDSFDKMLQHGDVVVVLHQFPNW